MLDLGAAGSNWGLSGDIDASTSTNMTAANIALGCFALMYRYPMPKSAGRLCVIVYRRLFLKTGPSI